MILHEDERCIKAVLGTDDIPETVVTEYHKWLGMYHRSGGSGPIGIFGCISVLRLLNLEPPKPVKDGGTETDWTRVQRDADVVFKALDGQYRGKFKGTVTFGTLAIQADRETYVREVPKQNVTLYVPDAPDHVNVTSDDLVGDHQFVANSDPVYELYNVDCDDEAPDIDWSEVDQGVGVYVAGDEVLEGQFLGLDENNEGRVLVSADGRDLSVNQEAVIPR